MKKIPLTQGKFALVDDIDYEYLSQWKWYAAKIGKTFYAGRTNREGGKRTIYMHQVLAERLGFKHRADHVHGNGLDNRRSKLRDGTQKQNSENRGLSRNNTSGHLGGYWHKQSSKWQARIQHNGKHIHLGLFEALKDAIKARKEGERKYFTHARQLCSANHDATRRRTQRW